MTTLSAEIETIAAEVLGIPASVLAQPAPLAQIPGWDSIKFINFVMAVEKKYGFRFQASEVTRVKTWMDLVALIERKRG